MANLGYGAVYHLISRENKLKQGRSEDAVIARVDDLLYTALSLRASDVHLQPYEDAVMVRYRIDGVLYDQHSLDGTQVPLIISRFKILAHLDIAQRRLPQDGHFKAIVDDAYEPIDFRVATFPTLYGEKIVIRILDRSQRLLALDALGMETTMYHTLVDLVRRPHGLFLVTGPTGAGKTTMLYAVISSLNARSHNIVTIEDPIEYELAGITQSQVNERAGFTFHNGLRSMLRQDPDIIMIGEIRDKDTAQIAIESALTGHLVLSTLHTNDAISAVTRLLEMGIEPFLLSGTMVGVLAQRLVRRLCTVCKRAVQISDVYSTRAAACGVGIDMVNEPVGCKACNNLGYKGRVGIFELLLINDAMRTLIVAKEDTVTLRKQARNAGMQSLMYDAWNKVKQGITSCKELEVLMSEG